MKPALKALSRIIAAMGILTVTAHAGSQDTARLQQAWRAAISHTPVPSQGCFTASYPLLVWQQVRCVTGPKSEFSQMHGARGWAPAGGGHDYAAKTASLTSTATGSFPAVRHLTSEQGYNGANDYSLQLNSNNSLPSKKACAGSGTPQYCRGWLQFIYGSNYQNAYMQYWLLFYNATCPAGWNAGAMGDCWKNSALVAVPPQAITELPNMSLSGSAVLNGLDTLVLTTRTQAYSTTGKDSVLQLAKDWHETEFNVLGSVDAPATFNAGASLTDRIALTDGTTDAPACKKDSGTSAETNNLVLKKCATAAGSPPYVQFVETAPK